jgi:beta-fructofuranosidase
MTRFSDSIERRRAEPDDDPHRPRYHFLPPAGWMNDPNGFIHRQGVYHLFYQYNPAGAFHDNIHWGHARSADLVHWEHRPIALAPTPDGPDSGGCWSGSAIDANGATLLFYSGVFPQTVSLATGSDDMDDWAKYPANPLIAGPPPGFGGDSADFRDPYVWREGEWWYMVIGSRVADGGGAVLLYRSADLLAWEYRRPLQLGDPSDHTPFSTGTVWECPNLFALDGRHVLIISFQDHAGSELLYVGYYTGDFDGEHFTPESLHILEYGDTLYAPQVTTDERGRRVLIGWLREGRDKETQRAAGWSGVMSLPRILALGPDNMLRMRPAPELEQLRGERFHLDGRIIRPGEANPLRDVRGDCLEIDATLVPQGATAFGLRLRCSPDGEEGTTLRCDVAAGTISLPQPGATHLQSGSHLSVSHLAPLPAERPLRLRVFLDRSVIEVFVNDRVALSTRVYPTAAGSLGVELFVEGGALRVESVDVWQMGAIWPD